MEFLKLVPNSSVLFQRPPQLEAVKCYFLLPYNTVQHSLATKAFSLHRGEQIQVKICASFP